MSFLYQRSKVSGVTRPAISFKPFFPNAFAFAARDDAAAHWKNEYDGCPSVLEELDSPP